MMKHILSKHNGLFAKVPESFTKYYSFITCKKMQKHILKYKTHTRIVIVIIVMPWKWW